MNSYKVVLEFYKYIGTNLMLVKERLVAIKKKEELILLFHTY